MLFQTTLEFECKCSNGTDLQSSLTDYEQSVPGQMCRAWFEACKNAAPDDADGQFACEQAEEQNCGKLTIQDATDAGNGGSSSSASGSATSSSPSATGSDSPSGTETSEASATSESAEGAAANLMTYGTPALVGGLFAIFGFAL
jgi:cobalamin biosynthesis Mg chelatase CobN